MHPFSLPLLQALTLPALLSILHLFVHPEPFGALWLPSSEGPTALQHLAKNPCSLHPAAPRCLRSGLTPLPYSLHSSCKAEPVPNPSWPVPSQLLCIEKGNTGDRSGRWVLQPGDLGPRCRSALQAVQSQRSSHCLGSQFPHLSSFRSFSWVCSTTVNYFCYSVSPHCHPSTAITETQNLLSKYPSWNTLASTTPPGSEDAPGFTGLCVPGYCPTT